MIGVRVTVFVFLCCFVAQSNAQHTSTRSWLIDGSFRYLDPSATVGGIPGLPTCCRSFDNGAGYGLSLLGGADLYSSHLGDLEVLAGLGATSIDFYRDQFIGWARVVTPSGETTDSAIARSQLHIQSTSAEARIQFVARPIESSGLRFYGGAAFSVALQAATNQQEQLITPTNAVFDDTKTRQRHVFDSDVRPILQHQIIGYAGLRWDNSIGERIGLRAGAAFEYPLTNLLTAPDGLITAGRFRLDVGLWFNRLDRIDTAVITASMPPEPIRPEPLLYSTLQVREVLSDGTLRDVGVVRIEETLSRQLYPLLPFVFFDSGQRELNANTYVNLTPQQTKKFDEKVDFKFDGAKTSRSLITLDVYHNLLNIIGRRMRSDYPSSFITLLGYADATSTERGDTVLTRGRSESVKEYLVRIWGIEPERIAIRYGSLAPTAAVTNQTDVMDRDDGHAENRRVEIVPSELRLLDPVLIGDTLREISTPTLRYLIGVESTEPIARWELSAIHPFMPLAARNRAMLDQIGSGRPPEYVDWQAGESQREIPKSSAPVRATFSCQTEFGNVASVTDTLPIDYVSIQRKRIAKSGTLSIDRYRLPLFQYSTEDLLVAQTEIIERYIRPEIDSMTSIRINAYTDRKGNAEANRQLSERRARRIADVLNSPRVDAVGGFGEGNGNVHAPFPNDTPEGRLYNRTVEVLVVRKP